MIVRSKNMKEFLPNWQFRTYFELTTCQATEHLPENVLQRSMMAITNSISIKLQSKCNKCDVILNCMRRTNPLFGQNKRDNLAEKNDLFIHSP